MVRNGILLLIKLAEPAALSTSPARNYFNFDSTRKALFRIILLWAVQALEARISPWLPCGKSVSGFLHLIVAAL